MCLDLKEALAIAGEGRGIACNQVLYHLEERAIEHAVLPWCERHGVAVTAYVAPSGMGAFPGLRSAGGRGSAWRKCCGRAWRDPAPGRVGLSHPPSFGQGSSPSPRLRA